MRTIITLVIGFLFTALPVFAAASTLRPPMDAQKCPAGSSTEAPPSLEKTFSFSSDATEMKNWIDAAVACPNACYDLGVSVTLTATGFDVQVAAANQCASQTLGPDDIRQHPGRGCEAQEEQPKISIAVSRSKEASTAVQFKDQNANKSRCNMDAVEGALNTIGSGATSLGSNPESTSQITSALKNLEQAPDVAVSSELPEGTQKVLNGAFDLSTSEGQSQAAKALQGDGMTASDAQDAISKLASGSDTDVTAAKQEIATKLNLNSNLFDVGTVQPNSGDQNATPPIGSAQNQGPTSDSTFPHSTQNVSQNTGSLPPECGVSGIAGNFMHSESDCGRHTYQPLTTVQGPYQYLCSTWQHDTAAVGMSQYSDCSYRNNTNVSTQVVNAMYSDGGYYQSKYGSACSAAGQTWSSCAYAIHVFGEGGFKNMLNADIANPGATASSLCGSALSSTACSNNASIFRNAGSVGGVFAELDRRLGAGTAGSTVIAAGSSNGIPQYVPVTFSSSPLNFLGTTYATPLIGASGSPYANAYGLNQTAPIVSFFTKLFSSHSSNTGTPQTAPSNPQTNTPSNATGQTTTTGTPTISLVVQPATTTQGTPIQVSWLTSGMSSSAPCKLLLDTAALNSANLGSQQVDTKNLAVGNHTFTLQCTDVSGKARTASSTVTIK